jgi:hypothetical protein
VVGAACCTARARALPTGCASQQVDRLQVQVLCECHDGPLGGHFDWPKTESLVRRLAFWVGQDVNVAEYVRTCQTCQQMKAEHGGPRSLLHPLPLRHGGAG